jgi:hypothetical protein
MISHKHKYIFIHIPKCGGTSVELALLKNEGVDFKNYEKDDLKFLPKISQQEYRIGYDYYGVTTQHRMIDQYNDSREKKYFTFTFVRNPWERYLSEYFYTKKINGTKYCNGDEFSRLFPTFKHFVMDNGEKCIWDSHRLSQIDFILNSNKNKLVNFVGRCENMQYDFDYICGRLKIPKIKLPYRNPTKHTHYTEYYDEETKEIVAKQFAEDIDYFGYEFGN